MAGDLFHDTTPSRARRAVAYLILLRGLQAHRRTRDVARLLSSSDVGVAFTVSDDDRTQTLAADECIAAVRTTMGLPPPSELLAAPFAVRAVT